MGLDDIIDIIDNAVSSVLDRLSPDDDDSPRGFSRGAAARGRARRQAKLRAERNRLAKAKERLNEAIKRSVQVFIRAWGIAMSKLVTAEKCKFKDFKTDMQPMTHQVEAAIPTQVASELLKEIGDAERQLEELEILLQGIRANI